MLYSCLTASGFLRLRQKKHGGGKPPALHCHVESEMLNKVDMHFKKYMHKP